MLHVLTLLVLVSSSMPADYSDRLAVDMATVKDLGLNAEMSINGLDSESKRWVTHVMMAVADKKGKDKYVTIHVDSEPFEATETKRVPVFLLYDKERKHLYRVDGDYPLKDVLAKFAETIKSDALKDVSDKL